MLRPLGAELEHEFRIPRGEGMQVTLTAARKGLRPATARPDISPDAAGYPVAKELVHRSKLPDVLPVAWRTLTENRYLITVDWPQGHPFYTGEAGKGAATLLAETIRQCGLLLAHAAYEVPLGHHFIMWDMEYSGPCPAAQAGELRRMEVEAVCSDLRHRGRLLGGMTCRMTLRRDGVVVGEGGGRFDIISPAAYRRLRGDRLQTEAPPVQPDPVPPGRVGRARPMDVLLAPAPQPASEAGGIAGRWQLRADFGHPTLFDHRNDHFPGMVLLEAALQAANATVAPAVYHHTSAKVCFLGYVEYDAPCWIESRTRPADAAQPPAIEITAHQNGRLVFAALLDGTAVPA
ncbi:ScbA/BarX family gamma-butyrolactone biosynthesis protein [Streptomyces sp. NRRL WC-3725]|uniref:ScbA/BarX family gamma-butyrolactone biosynthesis protein n=1 Tax=Streptomyces sp. NRRL WC-3725 TaxID=1463933 RepID=UPI00099C97E2|nr:ScbA/BarX family gamma-butyrolactone biosynthesis protein [Streptomyces sp. NRRL WC-3725]